MMRLGDGKSMRAADNFAVIRARMQELEHERKWALHQREQPSSNEPMNGASGRTAEEIKGELKARIIARNRLGGLGWPDGFLPRKTSS
jgi:hypothetical protein